MKIQIKSPDKLAASLPIEDIERRLSALLKGSPVEAATFSIERKVRSGKGGIVLGPCLGTDGIRLAFQHGKGGDRFRGVFVVDAGSETFLEGLKQRKIPGVSLVGLTNRRRSRKPARRTQEATIEKDAHPAVNGDEPIENAVGEMLNAEKRLSKVIDRMAELQDESGKLEVEAKSLRPLVAQLNRLRVKLQES